jgi:hypothetical protein
MTADQSFYHTPAEVGPHATLAGGPDRAILPASKDFAGGYAMISSIIRGVLVSLGVQAGVNAINNASSTNRSGSGSAIQIPERQGPAAQLAG